MFNDDAGSNVRAYAVAGSFDDCQKLVKDAFADTSLRRQIPLTSANSINVGRLLPQMIYYFQAVAELRRQSGTTKSPIVCTPSGNFGNLTAGLFAKRAGAPIERFVAATNANDVVPSYLTTGQFKPRASIRTIANAMDVGNPSNFERLVWLYKGRLEGAQHDMEGCHYTDDEVRATIRQVHERTGYILDPHSAIGYLGITSQADRARRAGRPGIFLATAHPAKFPEVVEPVIGRAIERPRALTLALERPQKILRIDATLAAVRGAVGA